MKKILFCLLFVLSFISFDSLGAVKKEKYKPDGKELFIINEYTPNVRVIVNSAPQSGTKTFLLVEKYKGMQGYVDKIIKTKYDNYKKIVLQNGEVFYLDQTNFSSSEPKYQSEDELINTDEYQKLKNKIEETKK